ncbi:putative uncharacterized protein ENSP00000383309 [Papio anubis]|uniref:putative uncharacterized protein ENSP00000383309 n=1 Tax=Papio anubis TaxID=9555 RepID=UPI0012AE91B6|nr:putative uncharacterized protein ENSP00000383309 [Papio anubis]
MAPRGRPSTVRSPELSNVHCGQDAFGLDTVSSSNTRGINKTSGPSSKPPTAQRSHCRKPPQSQRRKSNPKAPPRAGPARTFPLPGPPLAKSERSHVEAPYGKWAPSYGRRRPREFREFRRCPAVRSPRREICPGAPGSSAWAGVTFSRSPGRGEGQGPLPRLPRSVPHRRVAPSSSDLSLADRRRGSPGPPYRSPSPRLREAAPCLRTHFNRSGRASREDSTAAEGFSPWDGFRLRPWVQATGSARTVRWPGRRRWSM